MAPPVFPNLVKGPDAGVFVPPVWDEEALICIDPRDVAVPLSGVAVDVSGDESSDTIYAYNKATKLLWRIGFTAAYLPYSRKFYDTYLYYYLKNPNSDFFTASPSFTSTFDGNTRVGRVLRRVYLPQELADASDDELRRRGGEALRESGSHHQQRAARLMSVSNLVRITGNTALIAGCLANSGDCPGDQFSLVGSDIAASATFIAVQRYHGSGAAEVAAAQTSRLSGNTADYASKQQKAYNAFRIGKSLSVLAFGVMTVNGALRMKIEYGKWQKNAPDASVAQMVDAASDIGQGTTYSIYQGWLVVQGARTLTATHDVKMATDVMSISARAIPTGLLRTMQGFGIAGGFIAFGRSGYSVAEGIAGHTIDWEGGVAGGFVKGAPLSGHDQRHMLVSGVLGGISAMFMIGAAICVAPAALVVGTALAMGGMAVLAGQIIYDMTDPLDGERSSDPTPAVLSEESPIDAEGPPVITEGSWQGEPGDGVGEYGGEEEAFVIVMEGEGLPPFLEIEAYYDETAGVCENPDYFGGE